MISVDTAKLAAEEGNESELWQFDVHESVHRDIIMNTTNQMQLYRLIYYS